jgi:hypothetical protein
VAIAAILGASMLTELRETITPELETPKGEQLALFNPDEREQFERDVEALRRRLAEILKRSPPRPHDSRAVRNHQAARLAGGFGAAPTWSPTSSAPQVVAEDGGIGLLATNTIGQGDTREVGWTS